MTKNLLLFILLFFSTQLSFANKVDDLKTDRDVEIFLNGLNKKWRERIPEVTILSTDTILKHFSCNTRVSKWNIKNWEKLDINNDGRADLLFICDDNSYVAVDKGNNTFNVVPIYYYRNNCEVAESAKDGNQTLILFHNIKYEPNPNDPRLFASKELDVTDTLVYKFDGFIEYNKNSVQYAIDSITFSSGMCYGTCPVFEIKIDRDGRAQYIAGKYSEVQGSLKV